MIDDACFDRLVKTTHALRGRSDDPDPRLQATAEEFLFREARLLDERRYLEWVATFADDGIYWLPINPNIGDPREEVSLACDDRRRLEDRIARLETGWAHSQTPPSRTVRSVTNIEAWPADHNVVEVRANVVVYEFRRGHHQVFVGRQEHALITVDGLPRVQSRVVHLIDAEHSAGNLSFIV